MERPLNIACTLKTRCQTSMNQSNTISTISSLVLGVTFSWCLYGCLMVQFHAYYTTPTTSQDPAWLLGLVAALCIIENVFTLIMTHSTWVYVIDGYGHRIPLLGPWTASIGPALTGIGACMVQIFLARRILNLSKMSWKGITIAVVITLLALTQGILSLVVTTKFLKAYHDFQQLRNAIHITQVSLAVALVCDAIITFSTVTLLWRTKDTITGALNITLNKFLIKSVETGAVITVAASISLFFFVRYPLSLRAMIVMLSVSRLYTMTLLASLNGRKRYSVTERQ